MIDNNICIELEKEERILYSALANVNKTNRQLLRGMILFMLFILFWIMMFIVVKNGNAFNPKVIILLVVLTFLTICMLYGIFYNNILKYRNKNNRYFVTNKRVILYNSKKNSFKDGYIENIKYIGIVREKSDYGDIIFNFHGDNFLEIIKRNIAFEGVEYPRKILEIIKTINENINVYDDKPKIAIFN